MCSGGPLYLQNELLGPSLCQVDFVVTSWYVSDVMSEMCFVSWMPTGMYVERVGVQENAAVMLAEINQCGIIGC